LISLIAGKPGGEKSTKSWGFPSLAQLSGSNSLASYAAIGRQMGHKNSGTLIFPENND
jgi:hypothetical protein